MGSVILASGEEHDAQLRESFDAPDAPRASDPERALDLLADAAPGATLIADASLPWIADVVAQAGDGDAAILVIAGAASLHAVPALLGAGADGFVPFPSEPAVLTTALDAARSARARRVAARAELALAHGQLLRFAEDFRDGYVREKQRARELASSLERLEGSYRETVRSLAAAVEAKDPTTGLHIERVTNLATALTQLVDPAADEPYLAFGFLLHDVGKIGVPDAVLVKPGPLTADEFALMRRHAEIGARIVDEIGFLRPVRAIILHHHERWDGNGYPNRMEGRDIPRAARIFAVADAVDAMLNDRPYRRALSIDQAAAEVARSAGTQFDPEVAEAFTTLVGSNGGSVQTLVRSLVIEAEDTGEVRDATRDGRR